MTKGQVIAFLEKSPFTALFVDDRGVVVDLISFNALPTAEEMLALTTQHRNQICRIIEKQQVSPERLDGIVAEMLDDLLWSRTANLKFGANLRK